MIPPEYVRRSQLPFPKTLRPPTADSPLLAQTRHVSRWSRDHPQYFCLSDAMLTASIENQTIFSCVRIFFCQKRSRCGY